MRSGPAAVDATASPEQPGRTVKSHQTTPYYTRTQAERKPRVSSNFFRGIRYVIAFDIFLSAFLAACCYLVGFIAVHVPTAIVILGGLALVGFVVVRGAASS